MNVTGSLAIPNNGWDTYQIVSKTGVQLTAGTHVLRLSIDSKNPKLGNGNFDWFEAVETPAIGATQVNFPGRNSFATAAAVQNDGNTVVVGYGLIGANAATGVIEIARITPTGSPDPAFGGGTGRVSITLGSGGDVADDVQIEPDGGILVSGHSTVGANTAPVAVRLTADGTLDLTFGVGGKYVGAYVATSSYKNGDLRFLLTHAPLTAAPTATPGPAPATGQLSVSNGAVHPGLYDTGSNLGVQPGSNKPARPNTTNVPAASLYYAPPITTGGYGYQFFQVYYHDKNHIDFGSLSNRNLMITGPNGYSMPALYYGTFGRTTRTDVYVFYAFYPPGGSWDSADNGLYTLTLEPSQISNGQNFAAATTLGSLNVQIKSSSISGFVFNDLNRDGVRQGNETGLVNRYVYLDLSGDGRWEYNEPIVLTNADGSFRFDGLSAGRYVVWAYLPPGTYQTTTPAHLIFNLDGISSHSPTNVGLGEFTPKPAPAKPAVAALEMPALSTTSSQDLLQGMKADDVVTSVLKLESGTFV